MTCGQPSACSKSMRIEGMWAHPSRQTECTLKGVPPGPTLQTVRRRFERATPVRVELLKSGRLSGPGVLWQAVRFRTRRRALQWRPLAKVVPLRSHARPSAKSRGFGVVTELLGRNLDCPMLRAAESEPVRSAKRRIKEPMVSVGWWSLRLLDGSSNQKLALAPSCPSWCRYRVDP